MTNATKRSILRWTHIVFSIPVLGYIYSPFETIPSYAPAVRFVFLPMLVLAGFWMWMASAPKKSVLVPLGTFLVLLGIVGPLPLPPAAQPGTLGSVSFLAVTLFRLCFFAGVVCVGLGARRDRKRKQAADPPA